MDPSEIQQLIAEQKSGWSLNQRFYTDPAVYQLELERILFSNWFVAGHLSQVPNEGDFVIGRMDKESAIVVRGRDGQIRAFAGRFLELANRAEISVATKALIRLPNK